MTSELEWRQEDAIVAQFGVLSRHCPAESNVNNRNLSPELWFLGRGLKPEPYEYEVGLLHS